MMFTEHIQGVRMTKENMGMGIESMLWTLIVIIAVNTQINKIILDEYSIGQCHQTTISGPYVIVNLDNQLV